MIYKKIIYTAIRKMCRDSTKQINITSHDQIMKVIYEEGFCQSRILIHRSMIRLLGFTPLKIHPMLIYLEGGERLYRKYLQKYSTRMKILDFYELSQNGLTGEKLFSPALPWVSINHLVNRNINKAENSNFKNHNKKFMLRILRGELRAFKGDDKKRLDRIRKSIQKHGFDPDKYGDIYGQFLRDDDRFSFLIRGGKHRAAVLLHLGYEYIPVKVRPTAPRIIDIRDAAHWPLVLEGYMDKSLAVKIFSRWIQGGPNHDIEAIREYISKHIK